MTLALSLALAGCTFDGAVLAGDLSGDGGPSLSDGGPNDPDGSPDDLDGSPTSPDAMVPLGDFGAPTALATVNSAIDGDDDPSMTPDRLELYFSSDRLGDEDVFVSTRTALDAGWSAPELVANINTNADDGEPQISPDGLTLYFASNRVDGNGGFDVWRATRASRQSAWSAPSNVSELNSSSSDLHASVSADGLVVVFNTTRQGNGYDVFIATRATTGDSFAAPQAVSEVNTNDNDSNTSITPDGLTIVLDSDRNGTLGDRDIWISSRPNRQSPFSAPVALTEVNSASRDSDPWISADLSYILFASSRSGEKTLYEATR